jgi:hypothetical protein
MTVIIVVIIIIIITIIIIIIIKASLVARTSDADKEVWDILDSTPYATPQEPAVARKKAKTAA